MYSYKISVHPKLFLKETPVISSTLFRVYVMDTLFLFSED